MEPESMSFHHLGILSRLFSLNNSFKFTAGKKIKYFPQSSDYRFTVLQSILLIRSRSHYTASFSDLTSLDSGFCFVLFFPYSHGLSTTLPCNCYLFWTLCSRKLTFGMQSDLDLPNVLVSIQSQLGGLDLAPIPIAGLLTWSMAMRKTP